MWVKSRRPALIWDLCKRSWESSKKNQTHFCRKLGWYADIRTSVASVSIPSRPFPRQLTRFQDKFPSFLFVYILNTSWQMYIQMHPYTVCTPSSTYTKWNWVLFLFLYFLFLSIKYRISAFDADWFCDHISHAFNQHLSLSFVILAQSALR